MPQTVTITVSPTGETKLEVAGAVGRSCKDLTAGLEKALGSVTKDEKLPAFHQQAAAKQKAGG